MAESSPSAKPSPDNWKCIKCNSIESGPRPDSSGFCVKCAFKVRRVNENPFCKNCGTVLLKFDQPFCHECGKNPRTSEGTPQKIPTRHEQYSDYGDPSTIQQQPPKHPVPETRTSQSSSHSPARGASKNTPSYEGNGNT